MLGGPAGGAARRRDRLGLPDRQQIRDLPEADRSDEVHRDVRAAGRSRWQTRTSAPHTNQRDDMQVEWTGLHHLLSREEERHAAQKRRHISGRPLHRELQAQAQHTSRHLPDQRDDMQVEWTRYIISLVGSSGPFTANNAGGWLSQQAPAAVRATGADHLAHGIQRGQPVAQRCHLLLRPKLGRAWRQESLHQRDDQSPAHAAYMSSLYSGPLSCRWRRVPQAHRPDQGPPPPPPPAPRQTNTAAS